MTQLLVSVRSAAEAEAALAGGAGLIDVKEPAAGPLGRADDETIAAVLEAVAGRRPVSAAWGELKACLCAGPRGTAAQERRGVSPPVTASVKIAVPAASRRAALSPPLAYIKWGLSDLGARLDWPSVLEQAAACLPPGTRPVAVAYADWQNAAAPEPAEVCRFACTRRWPVLLLDTWTKDRRTLLDALPLPEIRRLHGACREAGVRLALAGSLGPREIQALRPLHPDWFAVRGAACAGGRTGPIEAQRVRGLVAACGS